jgi:hypothetical protein
VVFFSETKMSNFEWIDNSALHDAANTYHRAARVELHSASTIGNLQTIELKLDEFLILSDTVSQQHVTLRVDAMWEQVFHAHKNHSFAKSISKFQIFVVFVNAREFCNHFFFFFFLRFSKFFSSSVVARVRLPYHSECELIGSNEFIRLDCDSHRFVKKLRALRWTEFRNHLVRRPGDLFFRSGDECDVFDSKNVALSTGPLPLCPERVVFDRLVELNGPAAVPPVVASVPSSPLTTTTSTNNGGAAVTVAINQCTASQQASATDIFASPMKAAAAVPVLDIAADDHDNYHYYNNHNGHDEDFEDFVHVDGNKNKRSSSSRASNDDDDGDVRVTSIRTVAVGNKPPARSWIDSAEQGVTPTREVVRGPRLVRLGGNKKARVVNTDDGRAAVFGNLLYAQKRAAALPSAGAAAPIEIGDDSDGERSTDPAESDDGDDDDDAQQHQPSARKRQARLDTYLPGHARRATELKQRQREFSEQARKDRIAASQSSLQLNFEMLRRTDAAMPPAVAAPPMQLVPLYTDIEAFGIYVQYIASCEVDDEFAGAIRESGDADGSYFFPALRKIEQGLRDVQQGFVSSSAWTDDLRRSLDTFARFALSKAPSSTGRCQACNRTSAHDRGGELVLGGMHYDAQHLWSHTELLRYDDAPARVYEIGPSCGTRTKLYHTMQHWKYNFMLAMQSHLVDKRTQLQLDAKRELTPEESRRLIDAVCDDRRWNAAQLARYNALLDEGRSTRHGCDDE